MPRYRTRDPQVTTRDSEIDKALPDLTAAPKVMVKNGVWQGNAVPFLPARCPDCSCTSTRIIRGPVSGDKVRQHECRRCSVRFRSVEG